MTSDPQDDKVVSAGQSNSQGIDRRDPFVYTLVLAAIVWAGLVALAVYVVTVPPPQ